MPKKGLSSVLTFCAVSLGPGARLQGRGRRQELLLLRQTPWGRSAAYLQKRKLRPSKEGAKVMQRVGD